MSISRPDNVPFGMNIGVVAVAFRWPRLPVVVTSPKGSAAAFDRNIGGCLVPLSFLECPPLQLWGTPAGVTAEGASGKLVY